MKIALSTALAELRDFEDGMRTIDEATLRHLVRTCPKGMIVRVGVRDATGSFWRGEIAFFAEDETFTVNEDSGEVIRGVTADRVLSVMLKEEG